MKPENPEYRLEICPKPNLSSKVKGVVEKPQSVGDRNKVDGILRNSARSQSGSNQRCCPAVARDHVCKESVGRMADVLIVHAVPERCKRQTAARHEERERSERKILRRRW